MTSDFAPEVAKCPQKPQNSQIAKIGISITKQDRRKISSPPHPNRKSEAPSKNPTSDFALEVAKCASLLSRSV